MRKETKRLILRRAIYIAVTVFVFLLQYTASFALNASRTPPVILLLPLTVSIAMFEKEYAGMFFGLLAGVLTDMASGATDGVFTLFFTVTAGAVGLLTHFVFRNTVRTALLFTAASSIAYCAILLFFNCLIHSFPYAGELIKSTYLPSCIFTTAILPLMYYPTAYIRNSLTAGISSGS